MGSIYCYFNPMENITASIGETISIPIRIINDSNINSFSGVLNYNHEVLLLDTVVDKEL